MEYSGVTERIIASALKVHSAIGPGVLESVYKTCMAHELKKLGTAVSCEVILPVVYDGLKLDSAFRIDLLVENLVVVELKCVETLRPIHKAQLLTYLKLDKKPLGLLINFNVPTLTRGVKRVACGDLFKEEVGDRSFSF